MTEQFQVVSGHMPVLQLLLLTSDVSQLLLSCQSLL